jgi:uncharacterized protein (DUF924 family)
MCKDVLHFWFKEVKPSQWWVKDDGFDHLIFDRFSALHAQANRCELYPWRKSPRGRLAEIIVLDQFSRNMFRDTPAAFASDALALALSQEAIAAKADIDLGDQERSFLYMPFMHSESLVIHEHAVELFERSGSESGLKFELKHKAIIERFGRYPHRNTILSRESTPEEIDFLKQPGSSF